LEIEIPPISTPKPFQGRIKVPYILIDIGNIHPAFKLKKIQVPLGGVDHKLQKCTSSATILFPKYTKNHSPGNILPSAHAVRF